MSQSTCEASFCCPVWSMFSFQEFSRTFAAQCFCLCHPRTPGPPSSPLSEQSLPLWAPADPLSCSLGPPGRSDCRRRCFTAHTAPGHPHRDKNTGHTLQNLRHKHRSDSDGSASLTENSGQNCCKWLFLKDLRHIPVSSQEGGITLFLAHELPNLHNQMFNDRTDSMFVHRIIWEVLN